jgi:hypothetical protein
MASSSSSLQVEKMFLEILYCRIRRNIVLSETDSNFAILEMAKPSSIKFSDMSLGLFHSIIPTISSCFCCNIGIGFFFQNAGIT